MEGMEMMQNTQSMGAVGLIINLAIYAFMAYSLQTIANKTGTDNSWMAWVPILNLVLMIKIADEPVWWVLLMIIPIVNIYFAIRILVEMSQARGRSGWFAVLLILLFSL